METRPARPNERDQVLDLLAHWFDNRDFFARYNHNDPAFRDELCLVAEDAGHIVSTVQIFDRNVNLDGQAVRMGGIGSVYTLPEYRKKGIASALMSFSLETMERQGFELSLLFAARLDFYGGFGWRSVTRTFSVLPGLDHIKPDGRFEIERFDSARHLGEVAAIYDAYSGRFNATVVRDPSYWRGNLHYAGNPGEYFVVCRAPGGDIAAYARAIMFYGFPMIMEYGYRSDAERAMIATFGHIGNAVARLPREYRLEPEDRENPQPAGDMPRPVVPVTHSSHDPALEKELEAAGCPLVHHQDKFFMWRVISPERLGRRFDMAPAVAAEKVMVAVQDPRSLYWTADRF